MLNQEMERHEIQKLINSAAVATDLQKKIWARIKLILQALLVMLCHVETGQTVGKGRPTGKVTASLGPKTRTSFAPLPP